MSKRKDLKKIMVIGSGPIVIGQAAEFDYAGTQACLALKEEGYEVILVNSNPATIMTDTNIADKVYMEPLTFDYVSKIIYKERPDGIVPGLGGQTGLNLVTELSQKGVLDECGVEVLGTSFESINIAEDREKFKNFCIDNNIPVIPSEIVHDIQGAINAASSIGYPVVLRPAFTLGGTGGGFAYNEDELKEHMINALNLSPIHQVLIEKSVKGYREIEFEVMRDNNNNAICICGMENVDPVGIHTGDSIVVAPCITVCKNDYERLKNDALKIIKKLQIAGGCNVQFALSQEDEDKYYIIEINPRVSRSSALASKASGYPIARVTAKIAVGYNLNEINLDDHTALFEPCLDYIIAKFPRFPFDKFEEAKDELSTQMKATGEVMSIGKTLEEAFLKGLRSLETKTYHLYNSKFDHFKKQELIEYISTDAYDKIFAIAQLLRIGVSVKEIFNKTMICEDFLVAFRNIVEFEEKVEHYGKDENADFGDIIYRAKLLGFSDEEIAHLIDTDPYEITKYRLDNGYVPKYRIVDCYCYRYSIDINGKEYEHKRSIPYFYSTYNDLVENESVRSNKKKIIVLGSGPIRIGQGVEFDYSTVHAIWAIKNMGYEAIIINNNPETVSTDYTISDKLYFEPLTVEDVMNVINFEKPDGVIVSLGGQTAVNLANPLSKFNIPIIGTGIEAINNAEDRKIFESILEELNIPQPKAIAVTNIEDGLKAANEIGYPVLVRPSFVLGGRAMMIVGNDDTLKHYLANAVALDEKSPVLIDKYIQGIECEVDAICDGETVLIPGIMEHIERTGVHSGDSISIYPSVKLTDINKQRIIEYTKKLGVRIGIKGLFNIQYIANGDDIYVIEVNPRSSRTIPFLSKSTNIPMAKIATEIMLGKKLVDYGYPEYIPEKNSYFIKTPVFSFNKLIGVESYLSPEMKSTGEAIGIDKTFTKALQKSLCASGLKIKDHGTIFVSVYDDDREEVLPIIKRFYDLGFNIESINGTATFLKEHDIHTKTLKNLSYYDLIRNGHFTYIINRINVNQHSSHLDDYGIRHVATECNVPVFTCLDTVNALLDVIEDITLNVNDITKFN